jgi:hypothetical protein
MKTTTEFTKQLHKLNLTQYYKGIKINNVLGRWQVGIKSFESLGAAKQFIDTFKK